MAVLIQSLNVRSDIECWRAMDRHPVLNSINVNFGNPESLTDVDFTPLLGDAN